VPTALSEIERCAGTQFDPRCAQALVEVAAGNGPAGGGRDSMIRIARRPR